MQLQFIGNSSLVNRLNAIRHFFGLFPINAITLYPYVLFKSANPSRRLLNHEYVHCLQIYKFGYIYFYLTYVGYFIRNFFYYWSTEDAYISIPYEREAYRLENYNNITIDLIRGR